MTDLVPVLDANEARVNVTYGGENGDMPSPVYFDSTDEQVLAWVTEAVQTGSVPGIPANRTASFTDFVVDRFAASTDRPFNLIQVRPKTAYGRTHRFSAGMAKL